VSLYEHKQRDMVIGGLRLPEGPVVHFGTLACVELEDGNIWWSGTEICIVRPWAEDQTDLLSGGPTSTSS
jgi:hypothetical protein